MKRSKVVILFSVLTLIMFASCSQWNHGKFNRQKYTDLKSKTHYNESIESSDDHDEQQTEPYTGSTVSSHKGEYEIDGDSDSFTTSNKTENLSSETTVEVQKEDVPIKVDEPDDSTKVEGFLDERRNFNKLSKAEQEQALITFNKIFNVGLTIFIIAMLLLVAGIIMLSTPLGWTMYLFAAFIASGMLIFMAWIMSMVALNRVRKIDPSSRGKGFKIKYRLAQLVTYIGVVICVITITPGLILLILWALRVISF